MKKNIIIILLLVVVIVLIFKTQYYHLTGEPSLSGIYKTELLELGITSLASMDVPVSALLIYKGKIIGRGHNTVLRDSIAGGHAEINALSDALHPYGYNGFMQLNRDSLTMLTSFEPCPMCRGAMLEYKIKYVRFLKDKSVEYWIRNYIGELLYEIKKTKYQPEALQDSLFSLHPDYRD